MRHFRLPIGIVPHVHEWGVAALYFWILPLLQQSFSRSRQSINRYHCGWCLIYQDSTFYVSIFLASGKGREAIEKPQTLHYYFLLFQVCVLQCFIPHRVSLSNVKLGVLYKNLTQRLSGNCCIHPYFPMFGKGSLRRLRIQIDPEKKNYTLLGKEENNSAEFGVSL